MKAFILSLLLTGPVLAADLTLTMPLASARLLGLEGEELGSSGLVRLLAPAERLGDYASKLHHELGRCGGFVASATGETHARPRPRAKAHIAFTDYSLNQGDKVRAYVEQVSEPRLLADIQWFSSYPTRFYTTRSGIKAMRDLAEKWRGLTRHLSHAQVRLERHSEWEQPSVVLDLRGEDDELVIIGGHGDSINTDTEDRSASSPGADDNASGISVITEVIRVLAQNGHRPRHTLRFIAYAAEEVGLLGSMEISERHRSAGANVKGVLQFDGTNFNGSPDLKVVLISDHTDPAQNAFLGSLMDEYLRIPWGYAECGYACSDHYSWTYRGFTASFPAEARIEEENRHIHTAHDTLEVSGNNASHAVHFAKLGLAYATELGK